GGGGASAPTGVAPEVSRKPPINYRPALIADLIGSYSGIRRDDGTGIGSPCNFTITAEGKFSMTGGPTVNLLDGDLGVTIDSGSRYAFRRGPTDNTPSSTPLDILISNTNVIDGVPQISVSSLYPAGSCGAPGVLSLRGKPAFFVAEKFLEAEKKNWFCASSMGKPPTLEFGDYVNKGGEAVLGGERFSANSNVYREQVTLSPGNTWNKADPYRGQSLTYALDTKAGRNLAAIYDDAGDLLQVNAQPATFTITPTTDVTKDIYGCVPKAP
ncbi:hypothetical protein, partial [Rhodoferax sp.]|uniref:hypothetical protein n=1 Tax=Rhodoferax sp. TaxID=50421 RepID=UPI002770FBC9|nr:hypothetical protein [Rhodoferax sp.]